MRAKSKKRREAMREEAIAARRAREEALIAKPYSICGHKRAFYDTATICPQCRAAREAAEEEACRQSVANPPAVLEIKVVSTGQIRRFSIPRRAARR